jgi:hypothetical protein
MTAATRQASSKGTLLGIVLIWAIAQASGVVAYESWSSRGGHRSPAGVWCCGDTDCQSPEQVAVTGKGWVIGRS